MTWKMLGRQIYTADLAGSPAVSQRIIPNKNIQLTGCVVGIVYYNNPSFTDLSIKIYSDNSGVAGKLIATSGTKAKSLISTLDHAYKQVGFTFSTSVTLRSSITYHFVLFPSGYSGDSSSHISWRHSYPDQQHKFISPLLKKDADNFPLEIVLIGSEIK